MYRYIKGIITQKTVSGCVVECNNIGYELKMSLSHLDRLLMNKEYKLFTYLSVRENDMELIGFPDEENLRLFRTLISISKIGPRTALNILDVFSPQDFAGVITNGDIQALSKVSGIGKKGAGRIILELKGKINFDDIDDDKISNEQNNEYGNIIQGLRNMGFDDKAVTNVVKKIGKDMKDITDEEELMRFALKNIG